MKILSFFMAILGFSATLGSTVADDAPNNSQPPITLIITNANIWTGNPDQPTASTVLISNQRILRVGGQELLVEQNQNAKVIDAQGRRALPGLIDCHTHLVSGGLTLTQLQLREATSREDFVRRVQEYSQKLKPDEWVLGRGWTTEGWKDCIQGTADLNSRDVSLCEPVRSWIDSATGNRPALLSRMDGHGALANSAALKLAGITKNTPNPVGGEIVRDPQTGQPTGLLRDAAIELVQKHITSPTPEQKKKALLIAVDLFNQHGITMVHDMSEPADKMVFEEVFDRLAIRQLRIYAFCQTDDWIQAAQKQSELMICSNYRHWLWAGFKGYMDGSLGSRTAYMREPFTDDSSTHGLLTAFATAQPPNDMLAQFQAPVRLQLQPAIHAIGDQANHLLLNTYEKLLTENKNQQATDEIDPSQRATGFNPRGRPANQLPYLPRPRIEHAQHLLPEDIPRFAKLGVIASMQPLHKADDGRYAEKRLGSQRCQTSYAFKSLLESGATVCFGSDWPVVSNNPFLGIHAAVTGLTLDGNVFVPEQNITVEQALKCYTTNAAYACYLEYDLGMIKPGYLADLIILDRDILNIPVDQIKETQVLTTIVSGKKGVERK